MASNYIGVDVGKRKQDVVVDTSTTSKKVELVIDTTVKPYQAIQAVEHILAVMKEQKVNA